MHFTKSIQSVNLVGCNPYNPLGRSEDGVKAYLLFKLKDDIQVCFSVEKKDLENQYTFFKFNPNYEFSYISNGDTGEPSRLNHEIGTNILCDAESQEFLGALADVIFSEITDEKLYTHYYIKFNDDDILKCLSNDFTDIRFQIKTQIQNQVYFSYLVNFLIYSNMSGASEQIECIINSNLNIENKPNILGFIFTQAFPNFGFQYGIVSKGTCGEEDTYGFTSPALDLELLVNKSEYINPVGKYNLKTPTEITYTHSLTNPRTQLVRHGV